MAETLWIAVAGVLFSMIQALLGIVIGWLAYEIRQARKDISDRVHIGECNRRMKEHSHSLDELSHLLRKHEECFHRGRFL